MVEICVDLLKLFWQKNSFVQMHCNFRFWTLYHTKSFAVSWKVLTWLQKDYESVCCLLQHG